MGFFLFLLVTAVLFVRPQELVVEIAELATLPLYEWLIVGAIVTALWESLGQLSWQSLRDRPINSCVVGLLAAVFLSHASHMDFWSARHCTTEFAKVLIYYLLLVANVSSPARLRSFTLWTLGCIAVVAVVALLQYHELVDLPSLSVLEETDEDDAETGILAPVRRLRGTGLFHDPNDLSMLLVLGLLLTLYFLSDLRHILTAPLLAVAIGAFGYALVLTRSRGGLIALMAGLWALFQARYGWRKAVILAAATVPAMFLIFKGRQSDFGGAINTGTGQERLQLWSEGLEFFKEAPIFGIGQNEYWDRAGLVAHNSFVHSFAELGFFGGTIFLFAWLFPIRTMYRLANPGMRFLDADLGRLRPYLLAAVVGYAMSMLTLSRAYTVPTYLVLGLATVYLHETVTVPRLDGITLDRKLVKQALVASVLFLAIIYGFVRVFARFG